MSVQDLADESQKFTWPVVSGVVPAVTDAVRVTTLPEFTVVAALPSDVTVRVVLVAVAVCAEDALQAPHSIAPRTPHKGSDHLRVRSILKTRGKAAARIVEQKDEGMEFKMDSLRARVICVTGTSLKADSRISCAKKCPGNPETLPAVQQQCAPQILSWNCARRVTRILALCHATL